MINPLPHGFARLCPSRFVSRLCQPQRNPAASPRTRGHGWNRIEEKGELVRQPLNLNELIQESLMLTQPEISRKKVFLQLDLAPD